MRICYTLTPEWPTLILAPRRRRHSQFLIPWLVVINRHALKLGVTTGYHAHFRLIGVSLNPGESQNSENDNLGADRQVVVIVPGAVDVQMDAAM